MAELDSRVWYIYLTVLTQVRWLHWLSLRQHIINKLNFVTSAGYDIGKYLACAEQLTDNQLNLPMETTNWNISPVRDWRSTPRVAFNYWWPWPWIGSYGIRSCITHRPLSTYQIALKSEKKFVDGLTAGTAPSSRSHDTKTRTNIENPARSNLDIVL